MKKGKIVWEGDYRSLQKQEFFKSFQQKVNRNVKRRKTVISLNDIKVKRTKSFEYKDSGYVKRLTRDEKKEVGIIKSKVFLMFFSYIGGFLTCVLLVIVLCIWQSLKIYSDIWLGYWSEHQKEKSNYFCFGFFVIISVSSTIFNYIRSKNITNR